MTKRYDKIDFIMRDRLEPLPAGLELLAFSDHPCYAEHRNSVDARRSLRALARASGANALINVYSRYVDTVYYSHGYYECWGVPAVVGRPNPKGAYTKEELIACFHVPSQPKSTERAHADASVKAAKRDEFIFNLFAAHSVCVAICSLLISLYLRFA